MSPELERELAAIVVKDGVRLGGLPSRELSLALAWVWAGLPQRDGLDERAVNEALKAQLAAPACWLDTDHVELRRWLVDAGWLWRDGFGRAYRRVAADAVPQDLRPLAIVLGGCDTAAFVQRQRAARSAERERRRQAWQARSAPARGAAGEGAA